MFKSPRDSGLKFDIPPVLPVRLLLPVLAGGNLKAFEFTIYIQVMD